MVQIDMKMPISCDACSFMREQEDLMSDDYRRFICGFPYMGMYVADYIKTRHPDCPLQEIRECEERTNGQCPFYAS